VFDLEFHPADASGLIPVYLYSSNRSILELHLGVTFSFSPPPFAVHPSKSCNFSDSISRSKCFLLSNFADDLEIRWLLLMSA